ncbi:Pre-mRNA-splicing factor cef1 [Apiotrichum porosum]|uniref:Pre-mRNA-splicing factor CEF1 n=1 Tax=Apiotrichum porosum TaxID=105984 RepID=A0A427XNU9_9TREE|nr:Pre-mRNA-splicing factor cef1 [Apiotrichum porosum]RSH80483.1 Pre-mRNA-splicing factor cef1 [Apiotrichum porosum]
MVRIIIKGGVWRNTEDEILKAAISKYGKNQWARISSLLVRKTPKQCKARWYEWLDPSIKKVEWSKTEDEKLLHLAKLMPTQWRTIAPIVGRTATQCLERYQKLLDDAEAADQDELGLGDGDVDGASKPADGARGLRQGEIDPDPETRPARPDPVDMDDDEKEMLSEARARLANTQGKKAKRKARERQLEEARRVAFLQKKRELKAAGINLRTKPKKKGMDYNADIPFEKQPAPGFYDTAEERSKTYAPVVGSSLRALEGKRKEELEEAEGRDAKRKKGNDNKAGTATQFVQQREAQIRKLKEQEQIIRRRKLNLPTPQVGERELEEIVKIGQAGEAARDLVGSNDATDGLVGDSYDTLGQARMTRTPRVAMAEDNVLAEARHLRNLVNTQTPLLGDENTPLHSANDEAGTGFESATPRQHIASTPNPLATPARNGVASTPRGVGQTPLRTPIRDNLSINTDQRPSGWGDTPSDDRRRVKDAKRALKAGFAALPRPENNFELEDPEDDDEEDDEVEMTEEDAAERDARLKAEREEEERLELERRSQVVKKGLPRPANVDTRSLFRELTAATADAEESLAAAIAMINLEVAALVKHDSLAHPLPGTSNPGNLASDYDMPEDEFVAAAKAAIHSELATALGLPGANDEQIRVVIGSQAAEDPTAFASSWSSSKQLVYSPVSGWVEAATLSEDELAAAYASMVGSSRDRMVADATRAAKAEKKLGKQLGGYTALNGKARAGIVAAMEDIRTQQRELATFSMLRTMEEAAAPARLEAKREEVAGLERRERDLQARYAELNDERRDLMEKIGELETDKEVISAQMALDAQELAEANGE